MAATVENNPLVIDVPAELFAPAESSSFEGTYDMGEFDGKRKYIVTTHS